MKAVSILLGLALLFGCSKPPEATPPKQSVDTQKEEQYKRELDEIRKTIKGEVKIKLKKDGKGDYYSWEISGKDANDILKANDTLTKKLVK
jgi:hypothetical protein